MLEMVFEYSFTSRSSGAPSSPEMLVSLLKLKSSDRSFGNALRSSTTATPRACASRQ